MRRPDSLPAPAGWFDAAVTRRLLAAAALTLGLSAGCPGREIRLGDGVQQPDATPDAGDHDAGLALPPAQGPRPLPGLMAEDGDDDDDPALSADRLLILFNSDREGGAGKEDIWEASRPHPDAPFDAPRPTESLNTADRETGIALARDGLRVWFSSDRDGGPGGLDIYMAERNDRDAPWSEVHLEGGLSSPDDDLVSAVSADATGIWLARRSDGDDDYDLFAARRATVDADWRNPEPLAALNSDAEESDAFPVADGRLVYTRDGELMLGPPPDRQDGEATALDFLNSDADDRDPWVSADGSYLVFASDREGHFILYEAVFASTPP